MKRVTFEHLTSLETSASITDMLIDAHCLATTMMRRPMDAELQSAYRLALRLLLERVLSSLEEEPMKGGD